MPKQAKSRRDAKEAQMRVAVIDYDKCQPKKCDFLCMRVCPVNRMQKDCIVEGTETAKPLIAEPLCTACGICQHKCPFKAIHIINLSAALGNPIHQFGQNMFRLYRLPLPRTGEIVGLIGRNAIGKTTALRILSGALVPNLGDYDCKQPSLEAVIESFRGKELQGYFEKLRHRKMKISYKPQQIDALPKEAAKSSAKAKAKGSAKASIAELLKHTDERNAYSSVVSALHIEPILERSLEKLSGGELQRVAIAACVLRDADIYAIDEPTTHLDVAERLNTAKVLRSLADTGKSVIVIEHDLAVLDYLSDYTHILFGKQGAYGVVSNTKSSLNGINEFLDGFIKDENLRFRDYQIKFETKPPTEAAKRTTIASYPALEKSFPGFSLSTTAGELREGEVIGILGANATGKTTFVKMLAGAEKPDNTKLALNMKVSYKPQYIVPETGTTVQELFAKHKTDRELFKSEIDRRLHVSDLDEKPLETLSGGELQRTAVALALSQTCGLYLLDEPSAFIDVEDRLAVADAIKATADKTGTPAIVVDHDILLQDYVSDRIIVFSGTPSKSGAASQPMSMAEGMNSFLRGLGITYRRDQATGRPRANKPGSVKDEAQKKSGRYYYTV